MFKLNVRWRTWKEITIFRSRGKNRKKRAKTILLFSSRVSPVPKEHRHG